MSFQRYGIAIVGGGILGLATAMRITQNFPQYKVVVIEKEPEIAQHQTSHNSGVIHAGIYYVPGSQKANFCSAGAKLLRRFCDEHTIEYEMCGKVIVATCEEQVPRLEELFRRGTANGAEGLEMINSDRLKELEPHVAGIKGIFSPNTGIVNFTKVSQAYAAEICKAGGDISTGTQVHSIVRRDGRVHLETSKGDVSARYIINCAGLYADAIARMMDVDIGVRIIPFRGEYFSIRPERAYLVKNLIYPVPDPNMPFLGVHFTRRIDGLVEAGPNAVLAFAREGYRKTSFRLGDTVEMFRYPGFWRMSKAYWRNGLNEQYRSMRKSVFLKCLQALVPEIQMDDLAHPGTGVRAQAVDRQGRLLQDFSIAETESAIHVLNAPSPGATSSLTISKYIVGRARKAFERQCGF